jgi:4-hydroxy-3-methylbut-2-en-1-yl diphosphate reductase
MPQGREYPPLKILLCAPRGFCAGVDRAIQIVELALTKFGPPVYVRHEIVHNRYVVESLRSKGAVFVEELDEVPDGDAPVIFSAHGVAKSVPESARQKNIFYIDATCPLVSKVHMEAERRHATGHDILLIGHSGHPEVIGTMGQLPDGAVTLIETIEDAKNVQPRNPDKLAYITQTTLSVDDTKEVIDIFRSRFPNIQAPHKDDICYATTNRQNAVKQIAPDCDAMIVVGAPNSSNSQRLREVAERSGCAISILIQTADDIDWDLFAGSHTIGVTAGASAPEILVDEVIAAFRKRFDVQVETKVTATESISFKLPRALQKAAAE